MPGIAQKKDGGNTPRMNSDEQVFQAEKLLIRITLGFKNKF